MSAPQSPGPDPVEDPSALAGLSPEDEEWARELSRSWVEVYKKSATTLVLLRIIREHGPIPAAGIAEHVLERTGWRLTDRGLYRTLRRLADSGVLRGEKVDVARTGAKRQDFALTPVGRAHLERIERELV